MVHHNQKMMIGKITRKAPHDHTRGFLHKPTILI